VGSDSHLRHTLFRNNPIDTEVHNQIENLLYSPPRWKGQFWQCRLSI